MANGTGTPYDSGDTFSISADTTLYAMWDAAYAIGDTGDGSGIVFYDKGSYSDNWRYLEAQTVDLSAGAAWGCSGTSITGADGTVLGTGDQNTIVTLQHQRNKIA